MSSPQSYFKPHSSMQDQALQLSQPLLPLTCAVIAAAIRGQTSRAGTKYDIVSLVPGDGVGMGVRASLDLSLHFVAFY